ncbi:hypothetical protein [Actinokineospora pegani]|uniref:hypothetical protein n=1 Tax=Actinokineospora pegani TaxID=2654637 RepID=UPI0012E9C85F|nr:hypothetical protein [Actinokineospora pegani]
MGAQQRETTAVRRALSRGLLVLGGGIAATAAAWALSTASASAAPALPTPPQPISGLPVLAEGATVLQTTATNVTDGLGELLDPERARDVVEDIGRDLTTHLDPVEATQPVAPPAPTDARPDEPETAPAAQAPAPPQAPAVQPTPAQAEAPAAPHVETEERVAAPSAPSAAAPTRGSPEPAPAPSPAQQTPFATPAPLNPTHTGAGSNANAPASGLLGTVPASIKLVPIAAVRPDETRVPASAGTQPGVTPD